MPDQKPYTAEDFAKAEFARNRNREVAAAGGSSVSAPWICFGRTLSDEGMASGGWVPVRECPDPDDHVLARDYAAMSDRATQWQERAEKAERDLLNVLADLESWAGLTARELLDATWEVAYVPEDGIIPAGAVHIRRDGRGTIYGPTSRKVNLDADGPGEGRRLLDPPTPKRPGGAEDIEDLLGMCDDMPRDRKADFLASRGVRVVSEEDAR